jgi:hypothetical protein
MYHNGIDMRILVNGRPVREYTNKGLQFIESRKGTQYTIKVKNDNAYRVMAVVSVDGLDVITGKPAEESNQGYLIDSYNSTEIKGYRLTDENSAAFVFTSKDGSYVANATGNSRNSGVIGVRVFVEKEQSEPKTLIKEIHHHHHHWDYEPIDPWIYPKYPWKPYNPIRYSTGSSDILCRSGASGQSAGVSYNCSTESPRGSTTKGLVSHGVSTRKIDHSVNYVSDMGTSNDFDAPIKYDSFDMGTGWGEKQVDRVQKEIFHRGKVISEIVVYYASSEALQKMGVDLTDIPRITEAPKAFGDSKYCCPPTGWNG